MIDFVQTLILGVESHVLCSFQRHEEITMDRKVLLFALTVHAEFIATDILLS